MFRVRHVLVVVSALWLTACPAGRRNNELGGECTTKNGCPMGTTGLYCANCEGSTCAKSYCTKSCRADIDCAGAKGAPMTCKDGACWRAN